MDVIDFYNVTRELFPEITEKADIIHIEMWDEVDPRLAYSWFESLANALNHEMVKGVDPNNYVKLLHYINQNLNSGNDEVKNCIDVAFTENLFWEVPAGKAKPYWESLPFNLQDLYLNFHGKEPI